MIHCFNVDLEKLTRFQSGPLGTHLPAYAGILHQCGYASESGWNKIRQLRDLSRWMEIRKIDAPMLDEQRLNLYLQEWGSRETHPRGEAATCNQMLQYLRQARIVPESASAVESCRTESFIKDYRQYLLSERSLGLKTVDGYSFIVRRFLFACFPGGGFEPKKLKAADIIRFVQQATTTLGRRACQHTTTALRSFLRFLLMKGDLEINLANAVPKVAGWRLSELPRYLKAAEVEKTRFRAEPR